MNARQEILARIRRQQLPEASLPTLSGEWIQFADRETQFSQVLTSVGGDVAIAPEAALLPATIAGLSCWKEASKTVSLVPHVQGNVDLELTADPHELADVDVALVPGVFAVAENGAVWVSGSQLHHRAILFIVQHLVLVVPRAALVNNLHEAYEQIRFDSGGYGVFISGPSKTADIEQSLVIGAHGARSLTVVLLGE